MSFNFVERVGLHPPRVERLRVFDQETLTEPEDAERTVPLDSGSVSVFDPRDIADGLNAIRVALNVVVDQLEEANLTHAAQMVGSAEEWLDNAASHLVSLANGDDGL